MALGAYSIVRYSDSFRDERVNLGVVVWHPHEGFDWRFVQSLDRVHAVNPSAKTSPLRQQIKLIEARLKDDADQGNLLLNELSGWLREGIEFSKPYPTRLNATSETLDRLYGMLIPAPAPPKATEATFDATFLEAIQDRINHLGDGARVEEAGDRWFAGVRVNVGLHTRIGARDSLWRTVSLRVRSRSDQVARAKSSAMDIMKIRSLVEFNQYRHVVAVESPDRLARDGVEESKNWLEDTGAKVVEVHHRQELPEAIEEELMAV